MSEPEKKPELKILPAPAREMSKLYMIVGGLLIAVFSSIGTRVLAGDPDCSHFLSFYAPGCKNCDGKIKGKFTDWLRELQEQAMAQAQAQRRSGPPQSGASPSKTTTAPVDSKD